MSQLPPQAQVAQNVVNPPADLPTPQPQPQPQTTTQLMTDESQPQQQQQPQPQPQLPQQQPQPQPTTQLMSPKMAEIMQSEGGKLLSGVEDVSDSLSPPRVSIVQGTTDIEIKNLFGESSLYLRPDNIWLAQCQRDPQTHAILSESHRIGFTPIYSFYSFNVLNPYGVDPWIIERSTDKNSDIARKCRAFRKEAIEGGDKVKSWATFINVVGFLKPHQPIDGLDVNELAMVSFRVGSFKSGQNFVNLVTSQQLKDGKPMCWRNYDLFSRQTVMKGNDFWVPVIDVSKTLPAEITDANEIERNWNLTKMARESNMSSQIRDIDENDKSIKEPF